jgi:hypothetical protein
MSTAMERIMRERGDFRCFHEPFMYLYYVGDAKAVMPHFDVPEGTPTSYEDIRAMLLNAGEEGPVFFKDMSYYILDRMQDDREFADRITHTFLIRDPEKSIVSYYKLDPDLSQEEIGIETQFRHFQWLEETYGTTPPVIEAADVQEDTEGMIRTYCDAIGVDFLPHSLHWGDEVPKGWESVTGWHGDVLGSGSIKKDSDKDNGTAAVTLDSDPRLRIYYEHHRPFYEALREHKLKPRIGGT